MGRHQSSESTSFSSFSIKKKKLRSDYDFTVDILNKIVECKQSGTDDISEMKLRLLSALLANYHVDWSRVVFDFLKENVKAGMILKTRWFKKALGFGFVTYAILKSKGVMPCCSKQSS